MPELPEVETVRRGLQPLIVGRRFTTVTVLHPRAVRRHNSGAKDFATSLAGGFVSAVQRKGKYLWLPLAEDRALVGHLGMSGQLLVCNPSVVHELHMRIRFEFEKPDLELRFVDQRMFGGFFLDTLNPDGFPKSLSHIALDLFDPAFDVENFVALLQSKRAAIKKVLLDQSTISGIGNIYADEALWRARLNYLQPASSLSRTEIDTLIIALREVLTAALGAGGTSFDALYVKVNGQSGYFDRSLNAYGRAGQPCRRCGADIVRAAFTNRSSFFCPICQPSH